MRTASRVAGYGFLVWSFAISLAVPAWAAGAGTGNINVSVGAKALDEDEWSPAEEQGEIAVEFDYRPEASPINWVIGFRGASGEGDVVDPFLGPVSAESRTSELSLGVRKVWDPSQVFHPFLGGGLAFIDAEYTVAATGGSVSDSNTGFGLWLGGGVYWTLAEHFNIGLDLRFSSADVTLFGVDANAGGGHFSVFAGYHF